MTGAWRSRAFRRGLVVVAVSGLALGVTAGPGSAAPPSQDDTAHITVMGTTDLHGHVDNWDYYQNAEYDDEEHNDVGLAKISTLVDQVRADRGKAHTLLLDAGDTIQGTPLTTYFAKVKPITETGAIHPMAKAMNAIGFDAAAVGNHEFNYGVPFLQAYEDQLDFPLLSANTIDVQTGKPAFTPYVIKQVDLPDGNTIDVGILGLTTPGVAIWDRHNVQGKLRFPGIVEQAKKFVPKMQQAGADLIVVTSHSGTSGTSSYSGDLPIENASQIMAEQVPGIDAVLVGHAHVEIDERFVTNKVTGDKVLLTEPLKWGMRLSVMDFTLTKTHNEWQVTSKSAKVLNSNTVPADPEIVKLIADQHQTVVDYVNTPIGKATESMPAAESRYRDTPVMDFVNYVQAQAVQKALAGGPKADLPVLSIAAPFNRDAAIPKGKVTIRDIASLYIYPNTLFAVEMTGSQIKDYLEYSAKYFTQLSPGEKVNIDELTNAVRDGTAVPDYNYDMFSGISYEIDVSKPVGERITDLTYNGEPVDPNQHFAVATNNYRQSGGGGFPHIAKAPVLVNNQQQIRQLLIDYVRDQGVIDPADFFDENWWLTRQGHRLFPGESKPVSSFTFKAEPAALAPGEQVSLTGSGLPEGTEVQFALHSSPTPLGTTTVSADGTFSATATIPADAAPGDHSITATATLPGGESITESVSVTVSEPTTTPTQQPTSPPSTTQPTSPPSTTQPLPTKVPAGVPDHGPSDGLGGGAAGLLGVVAAGLLAAAVLSIAALRRRGGRHL